MPASPTHTPAPSSDSPQTLDRGGYRLGGGADGICRHPPPTHRFFPQVLPRHWTVGGIAPGGGADGEGGMCPLPCLCFQYAGIPHPRRKMPRESRIRESEPTLRHPLQTRPIHWTVGSIASGGGGHAPPPLSLLPICRHPPPRPSRGQSWRYPGKAVSGAYPQTLDRGRYRPWGRGRRGGGHVPPPLSLLSTCRHPPPRPSRGQSWRYPGKAVSGAYPQTLDRGRYRLGGRGRRGGGHVPPPLSLLPICRHPPPQEEDAQGKSYPGERPHTPAPSSGSPHTLDRGEYRPWGRGRRGGGMRPLPCLYFQHAGIPHPRRKIPGEDRIRESRPTHQLPLQTRPWGRGRRTPLNGR
jgi:hypothetical protein